MQHSNHYPASLARTYTPLHSVCLSVLMVVALLACLATQLSASSDSDTNWIVITEYQTDEPNLLSDGLSNGLSQNVTAAQFSHPKQRASWLHADNDLLVDALQRVLWRLALAHRHISQAQPPSWFSLLPSPSRHKLAGWKDSNLLYSHPVYA